MVALLHNTPCNFHHPPHQVLLPLHRSPRRMARRRDVQTNSTSAGIGSSPDGGSSQKVWSAERDVSSEQQDSRLQAAVHLQGQVPADPSSHSHRHRPAKWLVVTNELTKWLVSGVAFSILFCNRHTLHVPLAILGSICNVVVCKALKKLINERRPPNARKADPGMPSSHAQSLGFLGVYFAAFMLLGGSAECAQGLGNLFVALVTYPHQVMAGIMALALAIFMTWLRVHSGYHTVPQVVVGFSLGSIFALSWRQWVVPLALPATSTNPQLGLAIKAATWVVVAAFAAKQLSKGKESVQHLKQALEGV
ncbi:hypothetical protein DUNSADRAFT_4325 [Dunaliella salina]|uniref:Phosphatidic acid phosphatase type 2/haloperoxidase domain-containing protein n=1 Tax=Dunaliella salina TaxID=3046 RepID=A0ABQ7H7N2_DUNSA|nr:hypothetical protein DUNSADRAFT_4325 [Dunaliella salina]|eukprot:KAF5842866.1 hypothetical protein DUNSADRAFT_4325 [Dunaliella salina]